MSILSARDNETGNIVKFKWNVAKPPNEKDLADIFKANDEKQQIDKSQPNQLSLFNQPEARPADSNTQDFGLASNVAGGAINAAGSGTFGIGWLLGNQGIEHVGSQIAKYSEQFSSTQPDFKDQTAQGLGSGIAYFLPGIGLDIGLKALAVANPVAGFLGIGVSTVLESASEAGDVYKSMLAKGASEEDANSAASKTFMANLVLVGVTNKIGIFGKGKTLLSHIARSAPAEGVQEGVQTAISDYAQGNPQDISAIGTSALIGTVVGGILGGATGIHSVTSQDKVQSIMADIKHNITNNKPTEDNISALEEFLATAEPAQTQAESAAKADPNISLVTGNARASVDKTIAPPSAPKATAGAIAPQPATSKASTSQQVTSPAPSVGSIAGQSVSPAGKANAVFKPDAPASATRGIGPNSPGINIMQPGLDVDSTLESNSNQAKIDAYDKLQVKHNQQEDKLSIAIDLDDGFSMTRFLPTDTIFPPNVKQTNAHVSIAASSDITTEPAGYINAIYVPVSQRRTGVGFDLFTRALDKYPATLFQGSFSADDGVFLEMKLFKLGLAQEFTGAETVKLAGYDLVDDGYTVFRVNKNKLKAYISKHQGERTKFDIAKENALNRLADSKDAIYETLTIRKGESNVESNGKAKTIPASSKKGKVTKKAKLKAKTEKGLTKVVAKLTQQVDDILAKGKLSDTERLSLAKIEDDLIKHEDALYKLRPDLKPDITSTNQIRQALKATNQQAKTTEQIQAQLDSIATQITNITDARINFKLDSQEYRDATAQLKALSMTEVNLYSMIDGQGIDTSFLAKARDTYPLNQLDEDTLVTKDSTPEEAQKSAQKIDKIEADAIRKGTKAYKFADGTIITGEDFASMTPQVMSETRNHGGSSEKGYIDSKNNFVSASLLRPRKETKPRNKSTLALIKALAIVRNERGLIGSDIGDLSQKNVERIAKVREKFKVIEADAKRAGIEIDTYLRQIGMSEQAIDSYKNLKAFPVQGGELIPNITVDQKKEISLLAEEAGTSVSEALTSIGIEGNFDNISYTEAEQMMAFLSTGDSIESNLLKLKYEKPGFITDSRTKLSNIKAKFIRNALSPEIGFSAEPAALEGYKKIDRSDINKHRLLAYIEQSDELNMKDFNDLIPEDSKASERIALALDGKLNIERLTPNERKVLFAHKKFYAWATDYFVESKTDSVEQRTLIENFAQEIEYSPNEDTKIIKERILEFKKANKLTSENLKALDLLRMRKENYLPHIFERAALAESAAEKLRELKNAGSTNIKRIKQLEQFKSRAEGTHILLKSGIPKEVIFHHIKKRLGKEGYAVDAHLAFNSYVRGFLKEIYDAPMLKEVNILYDQMSPGMRKHFRRYVQDYMGQIERSQVAQVIRQFEWIRTLGFSPRSAINNALGGTLNTTIEGGRHTMIGLVRAMSPAGRADFMSTGIPQEIPQVQISLDEKAYNNKTERLRYYAGWLFNHVELGLRNIAYHTGKAKGESIGLQGEDLFNYSLDFVHKTQYRYGKVGMPMGMRGWGGAVFQFASYPVKTFELMHSWATKEGTQGKLKLLAFIMAAEGGKWAARDILGRDISSGLGFGIRLGDLLAAVGDATDKKWEAAVKDWKLAWGGGSGILPQGILPVGPVWKLLNLGADTSQADIDIIIRELAPIEAFRLRDFYFALKGRVAGRYPVYKYDGTFNPIEKKYELDLKDTISRAFGPQPSVLSEKQFEDYRKSLTNKEIQRVLSNYIKALKTGNSKELNRLLTRYPAVIGSQENIGEKLTNSIMKETLPRDIRNLKEIGTKQDNLRKILSPDRPGVIDRIIDRLIDTVGPRDAGAGGLPKPKISNLINDINTEEGYDKVPRQNIIKQADGSIKTEMVVGPGFSLTNAPFTLRERHIIAESIGKQESDIVSYFNKGGELPKEAADRILKIRLSKARQSTIQVSGYRELNTAQREVLVQMVYQMGAGVVTQGSTKVFTRMLLAIKKGDYSTAAIEMLDSTWAKQTPQRAQRMAEIMRTGTYISREDFRGRVGF